MQKPLADEQFRQKTSMLPRDQPTGFHSWLWLAIAAVLLLFSNGATTIPLAAWLAPVFLLRFVRGHSLKVGLPLAFILEVGALTLQFRGMLGSVAKTAMVLLNSASVYGGGSVLDFKWRHFQGEVILWAVRWYCRYGVSYRDLEQMMGERGVGVDHSTIYRWVQKYAPEIEKRLRWQWRRPRSTSWRVDETYVKVRGTWTYLYRALDKHGSTIDFYLSPTRNAKAAKRFLGKTLNGLKDWEKPEVINTDKAPTYGIAISELKAEGKCPQTTLHRQVKYLNNVIEADHGKLKQLIRPVRGFKTLKTAYATIRGFEMMRALRKGQAAIFNVTQDIHGEARIVERAFGIGASALADAVALIGVQLELQPA